MTLISKSQIDHLGERLKKGEVSDEDLHRLDSYRESFAEAYHEVVAAVRTATGLEPTGRARKTPFSIIEKLRREKTMKLSQMQDVAGCRIVVADLPEQDRIVDRLSCSFARAKVIDRRQRPSHGYRAVHVIATARDKVVEIQVRTELQNLWAQLSEVFADRIDARIKYGAGNRETQDVLSRISESVANVEAVEGERGDNKPLRPNAGDELHDRKALLRQSLREIKEIVEALPRKVN